MVKAILRWITNPELRANQKLLGSLDGVHAPADAFLTPYVVERPHKPALTVNTKYVFARGELVEYLYEVEGDDAFVQELCGRARQVTFVPLELTYPEDMSDVEMQGVLAILRVLIGEVVYPQGESSLSGTKIDRILYERYKNPNYIVFRPVLQQLLPEEYDQLKAYRATLPNPLGTLARSEYYPKMDEGTDTLTPLYLPEEQIADIRSKIDIQDLVGYTLLSQTLMVYHVLNAWSELYEYKKETALRVIKRIGRTNVVTVQNEMVYQRPESLFWDLKSRAAVLENEGWFLLTEPQVELAESGLDLTTEIATAFGFQTHLVLDLPNTVAYRVPDRFSTAFGFDPRQWLIESRKNVVQEQPPMLIIEGGWVFLTKLDLTSEDLVKVAYAAYRGYAKALEDNILLEDFTGLITVRPDFSVSMPLYSAEELETVQEEMSAVLSAPHRIQAVVCKDLESCVAARLKTTQEIPSSLPLILTIGDQYVVASNSAIVEAKPEEYQREFQRHQRKRAPRVGFRPQDPEVQGFYGFEGIRGVMERKEQPVSVKEGFIQVLEDEKPGMWRAGVILKALGTTKSVDLIRVPIPKRGNIDEFLDTAERLWRDGWFLSNWGKAMYRKSGVLSTHFLKDVPSIKTFEELQRMIS